MHQKWCARPFTSQVAGFRLAANVCSQLFDSFYTTRKGGTGDWALHPPHVLQSIALASGHQSTKGKDVVPHSPYRRIKVLNPRENNGLRGVPGAGNQYLSTIDTAGHKADDLLGGSGKQRAPSE
jgi:hypothetical protein